MTRLIVLEAVNNVRIRAPIRVGALIGKGVLFNKLIVIKDYESAFDAI